MERLLANKNKILFSCFLIIIPIIAGALLWDKLPDSIATHFDASGNPDDYSSKLTTVIGIPIVLLVLQLVAACVIVEDKKGSVPERVYGVVLYILPAVSIVVMTFVYSRALGAELNALPVIFAILGIVFIVVGNYLPKARQNKIFGIRIAPTLESKRNWDASNRFAGWVMCILGFIILAFAFAAFVVKIDILAYCMLAIITLGLAITVIYPYIYKAKHSTEEGYLDK